MRLPDVELTAHFHNTRGQGLANVLAALEAGVESFESSFGELGGCPVPAGATGNIATEDLVSMLHEMGISTGIDLSALIAASRAAQEVLGRPLGSHVLLAGPVSWRGGVSVDRRDDRSDPLDVAVARARAGGPERHREKAPSQGKLPVRERVARLFDAGSFAEDGLLAGWEEDGLGAEGVVTGVGTVGGRPVAVMANDPTVKAGSWAPEDRREDRPDPGARAVAADARSSTWSTRPARGSTSRCRCSPAAGDAGRIFFNQVRLSGVVPQVCVLFGPSAAGGAYIPAFCDIVIMRDGNASMYLGSPRMAEMVIGEKVTLEEMGGARMHTSRSGVGHALVSSDEEGIDFARRYLSYFPSSYLGEAPSAPPAAPAPSTELSIRELIPVDENKPFDMRSLHRRGASTAARSSRSTRAGRRR